MKRKRGTLTSMMAKIFRKILPIILVGGSLSLILGVIKLIQHNRKSQIAGHSPVARVYDQYLYKKDLEHLVREVDTQEEKEQKLKAYIHGWVSKQLLVAEASAHGGYNKAEIEQKLLDYRNDLLSHGIIANLVDTQVNREVSTEELASYYQAHKKDFILKSSVFRGKFVSIPKDAPNRARIRSLFLSQNEARLAKLKSYCLQFSNDYVLDESVWLPWEELIKDTYLNNARDKSARLRKEKFLQVNGKDRYYYFQINEYKRAGNVSPLELVSDQIVDIIVYKRKIALANKIKKDLLQQAQKNNNCVIYEY